MPTKRAWGLLILAVGFYFLANQTQVGWVYVLSSGLLGLLVAVYFYSRGLLRGLRVSRLFRNLAPDRADVTSWEYPVPTGPDPRIDPGLIIPDFHEDDPVEVTLQFRQAGIRPAFLISGEETCPFALPTDQHQPFFVPNIFKNNPVNLSYQTTCDRRGLYEFSELDVSSKGPFGLFNAKYRLQASNQVLIYPSYYPLKRLRLLETRQVAERHTTRVGVGTQVVSTREYRPGDPLRQIHWRSTARHGELVVKEFAEEDQPSLTVVLDLEATGSLGQGKFSTFETAVRIAASLAYYAANNDIPFRLVGASPRWTPPPTPLSWWAAMNYLAKVQNDGREPLVNLLGGMPPFPFVVALISRATTTLDRALLNLPRRGVSTLAVFITLDGALPEESHIAAATGLVIKSVSPHNWADILAQW